MIGPPYWEQAAPPQTPVTPEVPDSVDQQFDAQFAVVIEAVAQLVRLAHEMRCAPKRKRRRCRCK